MAIDTWFPTTIYHENLDPSEDVRSDMLNHIKIFAERHNISLNERANITGDVLGDADIASSKEFQWLNNEISYHCKQYLSILGVNVDEYSIFAQKSWPIVCKHGGTVAPHVHPNAHLSAVYYLQSDPETGTLEFHISESHPLKILPVMYDDNPLNYSMVNYPAVENELVIFPSSVNHEVKPYFGKRSRYSFSYDLIITKNKGLHWDNENSVIHPNDWTVL